MVSISWLKVRMEELFDPTACFLDFVWMQDNPARIIHSKCMARMFSILRCVFWRLQKIKAWKMVDTANCWWGGSAYKTGNFGAAGFLLEFSTYWIWMKNILGDTLLHIPPAYNVHYFLKVSKTDFNAANFLCLMVSLLEEPFGKTAAASGWNF